jgi:hypothetical protein
MKMTTATPSKELEVWANKSTAYVGLYGVPLADVRTPLELVNWLKHLGRNSHVTADCLVRFIDVACKAKGWKIDA